jgi:hypothetical protein
MGDRSLPQPVSAPAPVRSAVTLLATTPIAGLVLTSYATWAFNTVPAGTQALVAGLNRHDRALLRNSWVLHPDRAVVPLGNLPALIWLGLGYLLFLPLAYYLARGFPTARTTTLLLAVAMLSLSTVAVVADENFADPDPGRLSPSAFHAWQDLFPPGYPAVHLFALVWLVGAVFVACLLLDRPAARTFFARRLAPRRTRHQHQRRQNHGQNQSQDQRK